MDINPDIRARLASLWRAAYTARITPQGNGCRVTVDDGSGVKDISLVVALACGLAHRDGAIAATVQAVHVALVEAIPNLMCVEVGTVSKKKISIVKKQSANTMPDFDAMSDDERAAWFAANADKINPVKSR